MSNHFHLLLRPNRIKLGRFMRRLLTGYAVNFNHRHGRTGHLFQNRYKSIVCEEDLYLLELVRYIHLNPLRAGMIKRMEELDICPWSGHSVLMGKRGLAGQVTDEILGRFGRKLSAARQNYRVFVIDGISKGRRDELVGGGIMRSLKLSPDLSTDLLFDERVLGSCKFIESLRQHEELAGRITAGIKLGEVIDRVIAFYEIKKKEISQRRRKKKLSDARAVICYIAVREAGYSGVDVGKKLNLSRSGVSIAVRRGEALVEKNPDIQDELMKPGLPHD